MKSPVCSALFGALFICSIMSLHAQEMGNSTGTGNVCRGQCRTPEGKCLAVRTRVDQGCITYQCRHRRKDNVYIYKPIRFRCMFQGSCKNRNEVWKDESTCTSYKCHRFRHRDRVTGKVTFSMVVIPNAYGCPYNGTCKDFNTEWKDESICHEFECKRRNPRYKKFFRRHTVYKLKRNVYGCKYNGECRAVNSKWNMTELCTEYECKAGRNKLENGDIQYYSQITKNKYGCSFHGECRLAGEVWEEDCSTRRCDVQGLTSKTDIIKIGCMDRNNTCHDENSTWVENCITVKCVVQMVGNNMYNITNKNVGFGCPYKDKCLDIDEEITEDCITKKCLYRSEDKTRLIKPVKFGCMDADGKCRAIGETGYPLVLKGVRYENCNCTLSTSPDGTYSIGKNCMA